MTDADSLTGLASRARFEVDLAALCRSSAVGRRGFAVFVLDLDRFKWINETLGHVAGDDVLIGVANRLRALLGRGCSVARLSGDEFAVLADGMSEPDAARAFAARLTTALSQPFAITGRAFEIGVSIGFVLAPQHGTTPGQLARHAGMALRHAKDSGRGAARQFDPTMSARHEARRSLDIALRRAIEEGQFELHYQPMLDFRTGLYDGAEALIRWRHPQLGLVPPHNFIPAAEETGLIDRIGAWALRRACAEAAEWPAPLRVSANLSPIQLRTPNLAQMISETLDITGLAPSRLELEITEGVLIEDEPRTLATLQQLRAVGVRISLDDFGTGYASLSYLHRFPFDKIKIDQSFICGAPGHRKSAAIVRAVVSLGSSLGIATTAEGVETEAQRQFAAMEGCTQGQGFLISRPVPAHKLPAAFHRRDAAAQAA